MKKIFTLLLLSCFAVSLAFAQEAPIATTTATPSAVATVTIKGDIIDNMCAGSQKPEALAVFVKTHTKLCALLPSCAASGYSIYADGKLNKFDQESNAKIEEFLKIPDSKLQVVVDATQAGDTLSLVSIKNQE